MTDGTAKGPWEQRLENVGVRVEEDLRKLVQYINDEVVPEVRRNGSEALRSAAAELARLADRMEHRKSSGSAPQQGKPRR